MKIKGDAKAMFFPPLPPASCWLNYPGDSAQQIVGQLLGPNYLGEWMTAVSRDYDPKTKKTRVGLAIGIHGPVATFDPRLVGAR